MGARFLAELVFPGVPSAVSLARHCIACVLKAAGHRDIGDAGLIVSELTGNAIKHTASGLAGGLVTVNVLAIGDAMALIEVIDQGSNDVPHLQALDDDACSGRGLYIVDSTAVRWGAGDDPLGGRKVWAEVLTTENSPTGAMASSLCDVDA